MQDFSKFIREIPNFPEPGILFKDITPLLENVTVFHGAIEVFASHYRSEAIDKVVGIDARGFILDAALAYWNHHEPECNVYIPIQLKLR
jgi:adenine phosphoribosyltransferase